jgi:starch synthase (maltosyl-transferring)
MEVGHTATVMPSRTPGNAQVAARVRISDVTPQVECGRYAVKRVLGETVDVHATIIADGHVQVRAELRYRRVGAPRWNRVPMIESLDDPDRFGASFRIETTGRWEYTVGAWIDAGATWHDELRRKVEAGETELSAELAEGEALLGVELPDVATALDTPAEVKVAKATPGRPLAVVAEPAVAAFGAWYELFPRSFGGFDGVRAVLPEVADLGFDVVYLPPIHPIGTTNRKGRNNALAAAPDDPGSPWAIGGAEGGHKVVRPDLGTLADFDRLVERARELGLEIALDFAVQCSPDHPWLEKHPEWFAWRPDGSVKYAENPPKRYQDIVNVDFATSKAANLWDALLGVVEHWIEHGVRIFRVDNPHTKPFAFWEWLITTVHEDHPDVVFLAEAFTRPAVMSTLAKLGFSQSYTYFTWRNTRAELEEYVGELATQTDWFRPNFFVNTPDIFHEYLQSGGRPAFEARTVLAATLSPSWGMYSGFERAAGVAVRPGSEEYRDSEKYEIGKGEVGGDLSRLVRRCNEIRRVSDVFRRLDNTTFVDTAHERIVGYVKGRGRSAVIICVNLDPHTDSEGLVAIPPSLDLPADFGVVDLLTGDHHDWRVGGNYVRLPPGGAHVLALR